MSGGIVKPKKLPQATIERIARQAAGHLTKVEAGAAGIAKANEFVNDYRKGTDYSAIKRGGSEGSSVEMAALAGTVDDIGESLRAFAVALENVGIWARKLDAARVKVETNWTREALAAAEFVARRSKEAAGGGNCSNCARVVSGSAVDQLRHGRCDACRKFWDRNRAERPRHLWGGDSIDDTCQTVLTRGGVDYSCSREWGHDGECSFPVDAAVAS